MSVRSSQSTRDFMKVADLAYSRVSGLVRVERKEKD